VPKYLPKFVLNAAMIATPKISMFLMDWSVYSRFFWSITGIKCTKWDYRKAGERINKLERYMNVQMGLKPEQDTLPDRFTKEAKTKFPHESVVPIEKMVKAYYRIRKYDPAVAGPSKHDLRKLGVPV